ncbi:MAG: hypothetical protein NT150_00770 [Bacteroidetes bacterium]|nr:hypothetical protein [Bacteroidota bacterium]
MKVLSLIIVSVCLFQLSYGQHLLTDQPLVLNPSFAGSENVARFNLANTSNGTYVGYDQFIPKLKGGIGIAAEAKSAAGIYGSAVAIYSPKFTASKKYTFAPSLALGYQNDYYNQYLVGKLGVLLNSAKFFAGAFIQANYGEKFDGQYGSNLYANVHLGKKIEVNKNMSLSILGYYKINSMGVSIIHQKQISLRMKYKSFKAGIGICGENIYVDFSSMSPVTPSDPALTGPSYLFYRSKTSLLFSVGYERNRWSVNAVAIPKAFSSLNMYGDRNYGRVNVVEFSLTYALHKKKLDL